MNQIHDKEAGKANSTFIKNVRSGLTRTENLIISDDQIFDIITEEEYMTVLTGWFAAKGLFRVGNDYTKASNKHLRAEED